MKEEENDSLLKKLGSVGIFVGNQRTVFISHNTSDSPISKFSTNLLL